MKKIEEIRQIFNSHNIINVVLDTCTLVDIANGEEKSDLINGWMDEKFPNVKLFIPDEVLSEWNNGYIKHLERAIRGVKSARKHYEDSIEQFDIDPTLLHQSSIEHVENRFSQVNTLVRNAPSIQSKTNHLEELLSRRKSGRAPFHESSENISDAIIIFSSLDYFEKSTFVFVSNNTGDFCSSKKYNGNNLHIDIENYNTKSRCFYFKKFKGFLSLIFRSENRGGIEVLKVENIHTENQIVKIFTPEIALHKLEEDLKSCCNVPDTRLSHMEFFRYIEAEILRIDKYCLYLNTTAFERLELLRKHDPNKLFDHFCKAHYILCIRTNERTEKDKKIVIDTISDSLCSCAICQMRIGRKVQSNLSDDNWENLKSTYALFEQNNYISAAEVCIQAYEIAKEKSHWFQVLISGINARYIFNRLNREDDNDNTQSLSTQLRIITNESKQELIWEKASTFERSLIDFYTDPYQLAGLLSKGISQSENLIRLCKSSKNGGWTSASPWVDMYYEWTRHEQFHVQNGLLWLGFEEQRTYVLKVFQGLLASTNSDSSGGSKLDHFSEWGLINFIHRLRRKEIISSIKKEYLNDTIPLEIRSSHLLTLSKNIFSLEIGQKNDDSWSAIDRSLELIRIQNSFLTMLSYVETKHTKLQHIDSIIIDYICNSEEKLYAISDALCDYLRSRSLYFKTSDIWQIVSKAMSDSTLASKFTKAISLSLAIENRKIQLINSVFENITKQAVNDKHGNNTRLTSIAKILQFSNPKKADYEKWIRILKKNLKSSTSLRFWILCYETSSALIVSKDQFETAIQKALRSINSVDSFRKFSTGIESRVQYTPELSNLLDYSLRVGIKVSKSTLTATKESSKFYEWFLDPDNFNYEDFNPKWMIQIITKWQYQRLAGSGVFYNYISDKLESKEWKIYRSAFIAISMHRRKEQR